jgi:hypothetical protein
VPAMWEMYEVIMADCNLQLLRWHAGLVYQAGWIHTRLATASRLICFATPSKQTSGGLDYW